MRNRRANAVAADLTFTDSEWNTYTNICDSLGLDRKRPTHYSTVIITFALAIFVFYVIPNVLQYGLMSLVNPFVACVLLSDLAGLVFLFLLGYKRLALAIYLIGEPLEAYLYYHQVLPPETLNWLTNLVPALCAAALLSLSLRHVSTLSLHPRTGVYSQRSFEEVAYASSDPAAERGRNTAA